MPLGAGTQPQITKCPRRCATEPNPDPGEDTAPRACATLAVITPREAERAYGASRRKLACSRREGTFPPYSVVSGCILYRRSDIERLMADG